VVRTNIYIVANTIEITHIKCGSVGIMRPILMLYYLSF
jgi:hypothetical protein